jgi:transglutaminase-like putative cysteine protease
MLLSVAWAIQSAEWAEGLAILQAVVLVGGVTGIVLAKSRFPNRTAHLLAALAGWTWSAYLTGRTLALGTGFTWRMAIVELEARLQTFASIPFGGSGSADNYVFVLLLGFSLWLMAYFSAWAIFRWQQVWWAVIVSGAALLININYSMASMTPYLVLFLMSALLLVVRASVAFYEQEWRREQVGYSSELISTFLQAGLVVSIVVILLAWLAPAALASRPLEPFWDKVSEPWRRLQERSAEIFRDLNYQNQPPLARMSERRMFFGGPVNLPDTPVADVEAESGRYWRVMVFHEYAGDGWRSTDPDNLLVEAHEQTLAYPGYELRSELTQTVRLHQSLSLNQALIAAGQPLTTSLPMRASVSFITRQEDMARPPDASNFPTVPGDPSILFPRVALNTGDSYGVLSSVTRADEESLRLAGTGYPDWVVPRYLQLPDSLPQRVVSLAQEITEGIDNPYDQAKAIERYLRQIPYNLQIEGPQPDQDGVDYFLFDVQEGYCDYYASSMVVMLRAVGVPARYVRGYIRLIKTDGVYGILESDGHAWPEVYFPDYGWVEFEPTGGRPALARRRSQDPADRPEPQRDRPGIEGIEDEMIDAEVDPANFGATLQGASLFERLGVWLWVILGGVVLALAAITAFRVYRSHQTQGLSAAERVYFDLVSWVRYLLRIEPLDHQTPYEYARVVGDHVPHGRYAVERIAGYYVEERFGAKEVSAAYANTAWHEARPALWRRWIDRRTAFLRRLRARLFPRKLPDYD